MKKIVVGLTSLFAALGVNGAELRELAFQVAMPAKESPKMDGLLDDECWKTAHVHSDYYEYHKPNPRRVTNTKTDCMIVYDDKGIYTGIRNWEDNISKLRQNCTKNFQGDIWTDDSGEIYFDPEAAGIGYYKFIVNSLGKYDSAWRMDSANMDQNWMASGLSCAAKILDDRWEVEFFVPWSAFHNRQGPKPGDIWTFNHSRFRFGALGWGKGFSTSAPGASGYASNKFGYLYFSDGTKPDAKKVLSLLESRLNILWGIMIDGKVYVHDLTGTHISDLDAEKKNLEKEFLDKVSQLEEKVVTSKRSDIAKSLASLKVSYTNELAKYDASFASIKQFREIVDKVRILSYEIKASSLTDKTVKAEPIEMPLAGKYDLTPPKKYNGHNGWYRHNRIKNAYVTPHLDWCEKNIGEKSRPLFICGIGTAFREVIELEQRFGYEDALFHPGGFGATGIYQDPLSHGTFLDKQAQFETLLEKNPNVIVLYGFTFDKIPAHYRYEILRRVRDNGVGLVLLGGKLNAALSKKLVRKDCDRRALASLVPYAQIPGVKQASRKSPNMNSTEAKMALYEFGKGRVAEIDFQNPGAWSLEWKGNFETRSAFAANIIRWAQGNDIQSVIDFGSGRERESFSDNATFFAYSIDDANGFVDNARIRLRNTENAVIFDEHMKLSRGKNLYKLDLTKVPSGKYWFDVIPMKGDKCDFVAVYPFAKESCVGDVTIDGTNTTIVAEGTGPTFNIEWQYPAPSSGTLKYEIADHPYLQVRIKGEKAFAKGARNVKVSLPKRNFETLAGVFKATLTSDGKELASKRKLIFFPNHRFPDYTMIMWEDIGQGGITELFYPQVIEKMGYDTHLGESGNLSAIFNGRAAPYITRVCLSGSTNGTAWRTAPLPKGTNSAHKAELEKIRNNFNCYRPEIRKVFEQYFTPRVKRCAPYGVSVYNLGDECTYTHNIGFGDAIDDGYFFDFLKKRYGSIERYNDAHKTTLKSFNEVKRMTIAESKKAGDWPSWLDQVSYAAQMYSDTFQMCREVIKKYDPKARVGAEGSPAGNLEETVKNLEFWGPYRDVYLDEVLKSIAPDRVRGMWWGGYLRSSRDGFPGNQWEYLITGRANADEWFSGIIGSTEGAFAGDLTLAPYVQKINENHMQLKHGLASYMIRTPLRKDGFAIYYSWPSSLATTLSDEFKSPSEGGRDIIRFCYRKGLDVSFVTPTTLKKLSDYKLLFLPGISSLSDEEVSALKDFVKRGGKIYADIEPGVLDQYLARREEAPLKGMWIKYDRTIEDEKMLEIVGSVGVKQRESVKGLPDLGLVLRVRETPEQKVVGFTTLAKNCGKAVTLEFGSEGWIYECDKGFVTRGTKVDIASLERPFKLYAQFKTEQKAPAVAIDKTSVKGGDYVNLSTKVLRKGGVYRLSVKGPDGKIIANRENIFTVEPKTREIPLQFPYSDLGAYTVVIRDIATGLEGEKVVEVK